MPASDSDQEQGDFRLDGTLREQEEFMLKEVAAKFGITPQASRLACSCGADCTCHGQLPLRGMHASASSGDLPPLAGIATCRLYMTIL